MPYGTPRAVMTAYGDQAYCLSCGNIIFRLLKKRKEEGIDVGDPFFFIRDHLDMKQASQELFHDDERAESLAEEQFANEVGARTFPDLMSQAKEPEPLILLQEGYEPDQSEELNKRQCDKCGEPLHKRCTDYGPETWEKEEAGVCANCGFHLAYILIEGEWVFYTADEAHKEVFACPDCGQEIDREDIISEDEEDNEASE